MALHVGAELIMGLCCAASFCRPAECSTLGTDSKREDAYLNKGLRYEHSAGEAESTDS